MTVSVVQQKSEHSIVTKVPIREVVLVTHHGLSANFEDMYILIMARRQGAPGCTTKTTDSRRCCICSHYQFKQGYPSEILVEKDSSVDQLVQIIIFIITGVPACDKSRGPLEQFG